MPNSRPIQTQFVGKQPADAAGMYARNMSRSHAVRSGFSTVFHRPAVFLAELAWRWAFGAAALLLLAYSALAFLSSTPVSDRDLLGLSGFIPGAARAALVHIFSGSGMIFLRLLFALSTGIGLLWWLASAVGRASVVQELIPDSSLSSSAALRSLMKFNLMRTLISFSAVLGYLGGFALAFRFALAGQAPSGEVRAATLDANVTAFYLVFVPLALLIGWLWMTLNWYLTLATILALRSRQGVWESISQSATLVFRRFRQFAWVGFIFGLLRFLLAATAFTFTVIAFGVLVRISAALAVSVTLIFLLGYFAISDLLAVLRLAAYVRILIWDSESEPAEQRLRAEVSITGLESSAPGAI